MKITNKSILMLAIAFVLLFPADASAVTLASVKEETLKIEQSQDELAIIRDNTALSLEEKEALEIIARKNIVIDALSLSLQEVSSLRENFEKLPEFEEESREAELRDSYLVELDAFEEYYLNKEAEIKDSVDLTLEEVKALAQEIIDYRETAFNPTVKSMVNFLLLYYTENVISLTNSRLNKIISDINRLDKIGLLKASVFRTDLNKARILIYEAGSLRNTAKDIILAEPAVEELDEEVIEEATDEEAIINGIDDEIEVEEEKPNAYEIITESLGKVKATYELFLKISKDIRASFGTR